MLTKTQLKDLRNNICLNSLFLNDYNNNYYIKNKTCCYFFDSFLDYIYEDSNGLDYYEVLEKYDNIDTLYNYYCDSCVDGYDPLLPDDYIAYYNDLIFAGVVLYGVNYGFNDYAIAAAYYINEYGNMIIKKITSNKIYYKADGGAYIIKNKHKYYLDRFIKVNVKY